ncbi:WXG100 family type VII secretion target [Kitasatospora phosalacinea]|uniref:WXG100 family type VII secretion target n=1 Tax=Kitasatospora phosalacinea TaxID=2065 RepID=UPI0035D816CD
MGDTGFRVEPEALTAYAAVLDAQAERIGQIRAALAGVRLASGDFGKLPGSGELYDSYQEHTDAEQENFADLIDLLDATGGGLRATVDNYETNEQDTAEAYGGGR